MREVGSLGPISPQYVMYTVPRAGQRGFHQRIEYNKRIMLMDNTENSKFKINPDGGFKTFWKCEWRFCDCTWFCTWNL